MKNLFLKLNSKVLLYLLKICISGLILYYIFEKVEWGRTIEMFSSAHLVLLLFAILISILERILITYKWLILIKVREINLSFKRVFAINLIGSFWGLFLPSSLSTDIVRGAYLLKDTSKKSIGISSVLVDRLFGVLSLLIFGICGIAFVESDFVNNDIKIFIWAMFIFGLFSFWFLNSPILDSFLNKFYKFHSKIDLMITKIKKLILAFNEFRAYKKVLTVSFSTALLTQLTRVLSYYFISEAFGVEIPIIQFFVYVPIIMIVIMVPISIGGLGIREGVFVLFFTSFGIDYDSAVAVSFTSSIIANAITLFGGLVYLFYKPNNIQNDN